jgi:predicted alpha/beta-hydrolase family hydrolase
LSPFFRYGLPSKSASQVEPSVYNGLGMALDQSEIVTFADDTFGAPAVRGFLHKPAKPLDAGLVITHGAGANCEAALLVSVACHFAHEGFTVLRCDLPFRQARRYGPPIRTSANDREGLQHAVFALRRIVSGRVLLGGHSYGGRQASMLVAQEHSIADGLLLLSYPLHPPHQPGKLRTEHFPKVQTPALFVHGSRDPFGSPQELELALQLIPAPTSLVTIQGAGHDLSFARAKRNQGDDLPKTIFEAAAKLFSLLE